MELQVTIIGLMIIAAFYGLALLLLAPLWAVCRRSLVMRTLIGGLALTVVVAPWAEEFWIAWHFHEFCKGAGVHVLKSVSAEGYLDLTTKGWSHSATIADAKLIAELDRRGYRFIERPTDGNKTTHFERLPDGRWQVSILDRPMARYHYKRAYQPTPYRYEEPVGWKINKLETVVVDAEAGEVMGRNVTFQRYPSVAESLWVRFVGSGLTICPDPEEDARQPNFPEAVLVPGKSGTNHGFLAGRHRVTPVQTYGH